MDYQPPESFNIADYFLDERVAEGRGDRIAIRTRDAVMTYGEVQELANRFAHLVRGAGVDPEQRVIIGLPDGPEFVGALFGVLKTGAVAVMVNPQLPEDDLAYFFEYSRAKAAFVHRDRAEAFRNASSGSGHLQRLFVLGDSPADDELAAAPTEGENFQTHRDDPAIWLFSGGTTGKPKAVVQSHTSFANTTECYAKHVLRYTEDDITLSVPKLYFGYATGSNLLFPFAAGASTILFPERCVVDVLFEQIERHRPTILINVPTMINHMVSHPNAADRDLSSLRVATSAGEALPEELYERWRSRWNVEMLDGLGTAEMWHVFLSNQPGQVRPGTLGRVVPGFEVSLRDDADQEVPVGEVGRMWVRGNSRAIGYWQQAAKTHEAFQGEWYASGDMMSRDAEGYFTYQGRSDDLLKVSGKWLAPQEVENCLLQHPAVREVAVVGVVNADGLTKPHAFVIARAAGAATADELKDFVKSRLDPYKYPREIFFMDDLPRTHLGKVDRGKLKAT